MRSVIPVKQFIEFYQDSKNEYWLARAAQDCLRNNWDIPDIVKSYLLVLTMRTATSSKRGRQKAETQFHKEWYLREMRDLMFLTGITIEKAADLISELIEENLEDDEVPTDKTLIQWWKERPDRFNNEPIYKLTPEQAEARISEYIGIDSTLKLIQ